MKAQTEVKAIIAVHGGAGRITHEKRHRVGISRALAAGAKILGLGGAAIDAVVEAVKVMEGEPVFNAGRGAVPNLAGDIELDACCMLENGESGAVACLEGFLHPIEIARAVMEHSDHRLLAGIHAAKFAQLQGFEKSRKRLLTPERRRLYERTLKKIKDKPPKYFPRLHTWAAEYTHGTVGAVARDCSGSLAAATSTGGMLLRLPGRIGDSPIVGAGTYANRHIAVSVTGHGEAIMRELIAYRVSTLLPRRNVEQAVNFLMSRYTSQQCSFGLIALGKKGPPAFGFNTPAMSYGWVNVTGDGEDSLEMKVFTRS